MAEEFKPITTQEQLNVIVSERVKEIIGGRTKDYRAQLDEAHKELDTKTADYEKQIAALTAAAEENAKKYAGYDKTLADLQTKVKGYETASVKTRIAHELSLPYGAEDFLQGETEDDIRKSAEKLNGLYGTANRAAAPLRSTEAPGEGGKEAAAKANLKGMLQDLRGE